MWFGIKLSRIFGFAKSSQVQNQLQIKKKTQIRENRCWQNVFIFVQSINRFHLHKIDLKSFYH